MSVDKHRRFPHRSHLAREAIIFHFATKSELKGLQDRVGSLRLALEKLTFSLGVLQGEWKMAVTQIDAQTDRLKSVLGSVSRKKRELEALQPPCDDEPEKGPLMFGGGRNARSS